MVSTQANLTLFFLSCRPPLLEEGLSESGETAALMQFIREARSVPPPPVQIRITGAGRIYVDGTELKIRPMAKAVLLLFLHHPEGIVLKQIADYRKELATYYGQVARGSEPALIHRHVDRLLEVTNNELNVNISRVNAAMEALNARAAKVCGRAGAVKNIGLARTQILWE